MVKNVFFSLVASGLLFLSFVTSAQVKRYTTKKLTGPAPLIDGMVDENIWDQVTWGGEFTQLQPEAGASPSQPTSFKILYDDKNLYVLIRAHDDEPEKIVKRMSRRDGFIGDFVEINIDSYNDKRTAFSFTLTAAGVKGDEYVSNDGNNWDESWDPIWYAKSSIDKQGWIAEMRIPLSQLRFANKQEHVWGMQVTRRFFRNQERSTWQPMQQNAGGWVRFFGELHGLKGLKSQKQVEIMPYVVAKTERFEKEVDNPFKTGSESSVAFGVDGKIGLTSDITLDFTINPDFGQVEADPSQVNLSAFQVFFNEQRPFFIEGNNILNQPLTASAAGGPFNNDNLFYSRRIGRTPRYFPELDDNEFADQPNNTSILGALKLTGKNKKGFSFGILESITTKEEAEIDNAGIRRKETVEPAANYFVARVQQDINGGNTILGGMFTAVNRNIKDDHLLFLHKAAYTGGLDFLHHWNNRTYYVSANAFFSSVTGDESAIERTQKASERFFQRPDNNHHELDTTLTILQGTGATIKLGKQKGKLNFQTGITYRSPGLELNDIGFLRSTDQVDQWTWVGYNIQEPFSIFRSLRLNANQYLRVDFDGVTTFKALNFNIRGNFKNFWRFGTGTNIEGQEISNSDLRGGPSIIYPRGQNYWFFVGSDSRKKLTLNVNPWIFWSDHGFASAHGLSIRANYQPIDNLSIQLNPSIRSRKNDQQYITTIDQDEASTYVTGEIDQKTYSMSVRLTYTINPNLSIQYWGQPFNSRASYSNLKKITNSTASNYFDRFKPLTGQEINYDSNEDLYLVDEDHNGVTDYSISNPDFNFVQLRSNMVLRWEYKPGSTLFLVWTQGRTDSPELSEDNSIGQIAKDIFDIQPHNVFLLKYTYRFIL